MSIVLFLNFSLRNYKYTELYGFAQIMERFPESVAAEQRRADVDRSLYDEKNKIPEFYIVIYDTLCHPYIRDEQYKFSILGRFRKKATALEEKNELTSIRNSTTTEAKSQSCTVPNDFEARPEMMKKERLGTTARSVTAIRDYEHNCHDIQGLPIVQS
ncbi:uncharacterized protein LY89DRAFT_686492 [Mollisia scopiformis]|uniref:Uncharacterized protein n=1 Tax=Mollisia scopiformis TaxID=149040 RepID=A0A194X3W1_MOLSC|nr:uncharacterized protein LY89DRAFT_686492 [Mollisia scopiformis]KUJ14870.1 hypothetical protein LY89DRAFT_686492 [Mollisia scopiformis]